MPSTQMPTVPEMAVTTVADYFAAIGQLDCEAWLATFAADATSHEPVGSEPLQGQAALRQFFETIAGLFVTLSLTPEFTHISGEVVAVKWVGQGMGKNGREVTFAGIDLFELNGAGKIQTLRGYWSPAEMLAQLQ